MNCSKTKFQTKDEAISRVKEIGERGGEHRKPRRSYKCSICGYYHLTSKPKKQKQIPLTNYHEGWSKLL
jgi:hypothetical protein